MQSEQIVSTNPNLNLLSCKFMNAKAMPYVLTEFVDHFFDLFFIFEVSCTGDAVTDRFHRGDIVLWHDSAVVQTIGISPERNTVYPK